MSDTPFPTIQQVQDRRQKTEAILMNIGGDLSKLSKKALEEDYDFPPEFLAEIFQSLIRVAI